MGIALAARKLGARAAGDEEQAGLRGVTSLGVVGAASSVCVYHSSLDCSRLHPMILKIRRFKVTFVRLLTVQLTVVDGSLFCA